MAASPPPVLAPVPESEVVVSQNISETSIEEEKEGELLAKAQINLSKRWPEESINEGFRYNILLSLWYLKMAQKEPNFEPKVEDSPPSCLDPPAGGTSGVLLLPGEVFAFHRNVNAKYAKVAQDAKNAKTMNSEFLVEQGYKSVMGLGGNGVCHLASLINWAASEAGLKVLAPTDHAFAEIPGVPRDYWTSIKYQQNSANSQLQNLYIINNKDFTVRFLFEKNGNNLILKILK